MIDTEKKVFKYYLSSIMNNLTPGRIRDLLLDYGITILLGIFNLIFLIVKAIKYFGGKIDEEYKNKVEPVFKWIFFVLSILGVIGAIISIVRFISVPDKQTVAGNWVSLILTILLAFINIATGIIYVFGKPDEDYISIFLNKFVLTQSVNITNIIYYIIFIILNLSAGYDLYKKYTNKSEK